MLKLRAYQTSDYQPLSYQLDAVQAEFTASIAYCIDERQDLQNPAKSVITIVDESEPVGFFVLDIGINKYNFTDNPYAVLIRSFSINPAYQGKGYGKQSMTQVTDFIKTKAKDDLFFCRINEVVLSVNCRNLMAYQTYIKSGFEDTNKRIIGIAGEQIVLHKLIYCKQSARL